MSKSYLYLLCILLIVNICINGNCKQDTDERSVTAKTGLRVRQEPSLTGKSITVIPYNSTVKVIEESNIAINVNGVPGKWVKIKYDNTIGWAFDGFLNKTVSSSNEKVTVSSKNESNNFDYETEDGGSGRKCTSGNCMNGNGTATGFEGYGEFEWTYKGQWKNGKYNGQGTYTSSTEEYEHSYVGEWKDGKEHGKGIETTKKASDGSITEKAGQFKNGEYIGK